MDKNCEIIYNGTNKNEKYENIIYNVISECFKIEKLENTKLYICVTLTNPEEIRKINKKYRDIDKETDVLSFPMFEKEDINDILKNASFENGELRGYDILGDILISIEQVKKQAEEYGHSFERELSYMVVHGFYHLMGYDHIEPEDKAIMRPKEEKILNKLKITRS